MRSSSRFAAFDPHPKTELHYQDPFTLLVAVVLSAQATDASVNRATPELFRLAATPEKLLALGEAGLTEKIKTIGLYRNKAKNLIAPREEAHRGAWRQGAEHAARRWRRCPASGARPPMWCSTSPSASPPSPSTPMPSGWRTAPGSHPARRRLQVEETLNRIVPERYKHNAHHWLILHGRYVCKARKPECWRCIIADICLYKPKTPPPG